MASPQSQQSPTSAQHRDQSNNESTIRKRTRRACDKCSGFRVRCDGGHPCRRCQEYGQECRYARGVKKRGRKPGSQRQGVVQDERQRHAISKTTSPGFYGGQDQDTNQNSPGSGLGDFTQRTDGHAVDRGFEATTHNGRTSVPDYLDSRAYSDVDYDPYDRNSAICQPNDALRAQGGSGTNSGNTFNHPVRRISQLINHPAPPPTSHHIEHNVPDFTSASRPRKQSELSQYPGCRYVCLDSVIPLLEGVIAPETASDLLEFYFTEPDSALLRHASPYVLSPVLRKHSLLQSSTPRPTSAALLVTMLWTSAQTADLPLLRLPGWRGQVCEKLRVLVMALVHERDRDHWHRVLGGRLLKEELFDSDTLPDCFDECVDRDGQAPCQTIDDLLTLILVTIVVSGGDFKADCLVWLNKAMTLARTMGLNRIDGPGTEADSTCLNMPCRCQNRSSSSSSPVASIEVQEERRRVFWLLFSLDRHLALSFNANLFIHDDQVHVYGPLPEEVWDNLEAVPYDTLTRRTFGPPTVVTGVGFFEYFTPLMTILGDVIETNQRSLHPRWGALDDTPAVAMVEKSLEACKQSIDTLSALHSVEQYTDGTIPTTHHGNAVLTPSTAYSDQDPFNNPAIHFHRPRKPRRGQVLLVTAYARFLVHVLHILLHGKWDAVSMLSPDTPPASPRTHGSQFPDPSKWMASESDNFLKASSHAIMASGAVEMMLFADPELTFMPYLLGIYLLHGSFIMLLFADRMPQVGPNESVERACETIIRAHEVCCITLNTEFQKRYRKVLRGTLSEVRKNLSGETADGGGGHVVNATMRERDAARETEGRQARQRALSLYRWTRGSRGLCL